jgi:hypothetical protein
MSELVVIAERGASVLIRVDENTGQILDRRHGRLFPPQGIESALARGYWRPFAGDPQEIEQALTRAEKIMANGGMASLPAEDGHEYPVSA